MLEALGFAAVNDGEFRRVSYRSHFVDGAARQIPLERLAVSPQCGFASTVAGNPVTQDTQKAKLALVQETARRVWG